MSTLLAPTHVDSTLAARAREVVKTYGRGDTAVRALDGANLDIPARRFTAIMGPSGSGKSTLMHVLAGLDDATSGEVLLGGTDVTAMSEREMTLLRRQRLGFVFQSFNLVPALTAEENIVLPLRLAGRRPEPAWLDEVARTLGLTSRLRHRPAELSGGQQQRVAVARALITRPEIVFADEPTGNLDSQHGEALLRLLQHAARGFGQTIVMVTHDPSAAAHADRVVFLADGRVVDEIASPTTSLVLTRMAALGQRGTEKGCDRCFVSR